MPSGSKTLLRGWQMARFMTFLIVLTASIAFALFVKDRDLGWWAGSATIASLIREPAKYDGKNVTVTGTVVGRLGLMGVGGFRLRDSTSGDEIAIFSTKGIPPNGSSISISGKFRQALTLGQHQYSVIVRDK